MYAKQLFVALGIICIHSLPHLSCRHFKTNKQKTYPPCCLLLKIPADLKSPANLKEGVTGLFEVLMRVRQEAEGWKCCVK